MDTTRARSNRREGHDLDFEAILEAVRAAVFVVNVSGNIELVNRELVRLTGWSPSDVLGRPVDVLVPSPSRCRRSNGAAFDAEVISSPVLLDH